MCDCDSSSDTMLHNSAGAADLGNLSPSAWSEELCAVCCEFLEAAIHTTIRARNIYSPELFERAKIYSIFIRRSRHPQLNTYISSTVLKLKPLILNGSLQEVAVVFYDPQGKPLERVTFRLQLLFLDQANPALNVAALESNLSSVLLKLQFIDSLLKPLPQGCTFEVVAYSTARTGVDMQFFVEDSTHTAELPQPISTHSLKSISVERCLQMQVFLEETANKQ